MRVGTSLLVVMALASLARAQPADPRQPESGYIGRDIIALEIDDCPVIDPALSQGELRRRGSEHYERGETLYVQGDYDGAVQELIASYCIIPYYTILKDIGQAYERSLEYEKAIGYLERYVHAIPDDAKRSSQCAADPHEDKANVGRRITVLLDLKARLFVQTTPGGAKITIGNQAGIAARAHSGDQIEIRGGRYEMTIERDGYEPISQDIDIKIGKPYTFYFPLVPLKGRLSVLVDPPDARIFVDDRLVGFGRYDESVAGTSYNLLVEAPNHDSMTKRIEVLPNQTRREIIELPPQKQIGRRQLIAFGTLAGGVISGSILYAFNNTPLASAGSVAGAAAGLIGGYFQIPDHLALGTSNLTITSTLTGGIAGTAIASVFTSRLEIIQPVLGLSALVGGAFGYWAGEQFGVQPGDAALLNTGILWGTTAGSLFALSFDPPRRVGAGLVLSGLGMGGISGVLLTRYFKVSRTHAVLVDVGGMIGIIGGLATESLVYPTNQQTGTDAQIKKRSQEHLSNFALGGMLVGLIGAGVLTRNLDDTKVPVGPAIGTATGADGKTTTTYGILGTW